MLAIGASAGAQLQEEVLRNLASARDGDGTELVGPGLHAADSRSPATKRQRRGSSSLRNFGPKRTTTPRGRTSLLQSAESISHLHQILQTHLGQLDAVALAAASDRLVALLHAHVAMGDLEHHLNPRLYPSSSGSSRGGAASREADVFAAAADSLDVPDPAAQADYLPCPDTSCSPSQAAGVAAAAAADARATTGGDQSPAKQPSAGRVRVKLLRAFSTIMGGAEKLLQQQQPAEGQQAQPQQQQQQQQQQQVSFPPSCAVALLRGMVRVLSVAFVEDRLEARWQRLALQLAACVARPDSSSSSSSSSSSKESTPVSISNSNSSSRSSSSSGSNGDGGGKAVGAALSVQQVVACTWAATKLGLIPAKPSQQPVRQAGAELGDRAQAAVVAKLWAFLLQELLCACPRMNAMEVSNVAWSLSASGQSQPALMDRLVERAYHLLALHFQRPRSTASAAAAAAALGPRGVPQPSCCLGPKDCFNSQDVSNLVWVLGRTQHKAPHLLQLLEARALQLIPGAHSPQGPPTPGNPQQPPPHQPPQPLQQASHAAGVPGMASRLPSSITASQHLPDTPAPSPPLLSSSRSSSSSRAAGHTLKPSSHALPPLSHPTPLLVPPSSSAHRPTLPPSSTNPPPQAADPQLLLHPPSSPSPQPPQHPLPRGEHAPLAAHAAVPSVAEGGSAAHSPSQCAPLEPQHVANIAWGLARAEWAAPRLLRALATVVLTDRVPLASFQTLHLAQLAWALAKARDSTQQKATTSPPLPFALKGQLSHGSPPGADAEHAAFADLQLLKRITAALAGRVAAMGASELCMVAWSLAVMRRPARRLYGALAVRARELLDAGQLSASNQATLLWAYARQGILSEGLFDALCAAVLPHMRGCSTGAISMVMWALAATASLGAGRGAALVRRHAALAREASLVLHAELHSFSGSEVSNLAWALAEMGHYEPPLWDAMAQYLLQPQPVPSSRSRSRRRRSSNAYISPQQQVPTAAGEFAAGHPQYAPQLPAAAPLLAGQGSEAGWGMASMGPAHYAEPLLTRMQAFELSKLVWAYAKVGHVDEQLFSEVSELLCVAASHLPRRFNKAKRRAAAAAAAVHVRLGAGALLSAGVAASAPPSSQHEPSQPSLLQPASVAAVSQMPAVRPALGQEPSPTPHPPPIHHVLHAGTVSRAMWAFAMLGLHDDPVLPALMPHVRAVLPFMEPRDVAAVMWALAASGLGAEDDDLVVACMTRATAQLATYTPSQLAELLWAVATLQSQPGRTYGLLALVDPVVAHTKRTVQQQQLASARTRLLTQSHAGLRLEDVATIMWALTVFRHYDQNFTKHVARAITALLQHAHHPGKQQQQQQQESAPIGDAPTHPLGPDAAPVPSSHTGASSHPASSSSSSSSSGSGGSGNGGISSWPSPSLPSPAPSPDPEHLASLLHSLATYSTYQPGLFHAAAQALVHQLDSLDTEQLVQLIWVYAAALSACLATARSIAGEGGPYNGGQAGNGSRRVHPDRGGPAPRGRPQAAAAWEPRRAGLPSKGGAANGRALLCTHAGLLRGAQVMLSAALPAGKRRVRLLPRELLLLWQAHQLCAAATPEAAQLLAALPSHAGLHGHEGQGDVSSMSLQHTASSPATDPSTASLQTQGTTLAAFRLRPELWAQAVQTCCLLPQTKRRRQQAELVSALESLGFSTLPRVSSSVSLPEDLVTLAMAGPDFVGAQQGRMKVAVMQVVPGEHTLLTHPHKLLAEHQVKVDLLQQQGWRVVRVPLAEWGQNKGHESRVQDLAARLHGEGKKPNDI